MDAYQVQKLAELRLLLVQAVEKLAPYGIRNRVLGAVLGAEFRRLAGETALREVGFQKLTKFIQECCPELAVTREVGILDILVSLRAESEIGSSGAEAPPATPGPVESLEEPAPAEWSPWSSRWLDGRYSAIELGERVADPGPYVRAALAAIDRGEYQEAAAGLRPLVAQVLADTRTLGVTRVQREVVAACCRADAELAVRAGNWELGADLGLVALEILGVDDHPILPAWRIGQFVTTLHFGLESLQSGPDEVAQSTSSAALRTLCITAGRAGAIRESLATAVLGGRSRLYFDVRDFIVSTLLQDPFVPRDLKKKRDRELEYEALQIVSGITRELRSEALQLRDLLLECIGDPLRVHANALVALLGKHRGLLHSAENAAAAEIQPLITREFSRYLSTAQLTTDSSIDTLAFQTHYAQTLEALAARQAAGSWLLSFVLAPVAHRISRLVHESRLDASLRQRPDLQLRRQRRKYPLAMVDREISIPLEVHNTGPGLASDAVLEVGPLPEGIDPTAMAIEFGAIGPGAYSTRYLTLSLAEPLRALRIPVRLAYRDVLGERFANSDDLMVEAQSGDPDWEALLANHPYTLNPVDEPSKLRGRLAQLTKLRINSATLTSTIVWGQKRVGKTSVARVLYHELRTRDDRIVLYTRKGDIAGYDEGAFGRDLAERIVDECKAQGLLEQPIELPTIGDFGGRLTRLARFFEGLRAAGVTRPFTLILDEFDDFNPGFYRGQRGENFFATLRALSERQVAFVFVGSERMPAIFRRYAQLLNKCDTLQIDIIDNASDVHEIIEQPVGGYIEFDREAVLLVAHLSGGNPYYANLLSARLLVAMVTARRTFVDPIDVRRAASALAEDSSTLHWSHLWEDGDAEDDAEQVRRKYSAALVLAAFGGEPTARSLRFADVEAYLRQECNGGVPAGLEIESTLETLVRRHVLTAEGAGPDRRYNVAFEIFRWWIAKNGHVQLLLPHRGGPLAENAPGNSRPDTAEVTPLILLPDFPLADDELIPICEGLLYRGKHVDAMQMKQWLRQFRDDARIILAFKLVTALRNRWYVDETRLSLAMDKAFNRALHVARELGIVPKHISAAKASTKLTSDYLRRDIPRGMIANLFVSYFGDGLKSGAMIARSLKKEKRIASGGSLERAAEWLEQEGGLEPTDRFVLIVDDFVGSGYQAGKELKRFVKQAASRPRLQRALDQGRVAYLPLWAFRVGVDVIREETPSLRVEPIMLMDESDQAFLPEASIFDSDDERKICQGVCHHIGSQLYKDHPLGWASLQAMTVFPETVPNATLPILWCAGFVDGREWRPLFAR